MGKLNLKFKKNESFYIRDGWFEKAINAIEENKDVNIFYKNNGISYLGIGSNMVKGLKYWLQASNILDAKTNQLTSFGEYILQYDRYFDTTFSWYLVHYYLTINQELCPIFNGFFNSHVKSFSKDELVEYIMSLYKEDDPEINVKYVEADTNVFLKSYINDEIIDNPEDNYVCPLSELNLIEKNEGEFKKNKPSYATLDYLIIYYALTKSYGFKPFKIEDSINKPNGPYMVFNLDKNLYLQYLDEMKKHGLITINKTAGLNAVYFEKKYTLGKIFDLYFRR